MERIYWYFTKEYNKVYDRLDVNFDYYFGESFYNDMMPSVLEELKQKGIAKEDQGALVVFLKIIDCACNCSKERWKFFWYDFRSCYNEI